MPEAGRRVTIPLKRIFGKDSMGEGRDGEDVLTGQGPDLPVRIWPAPNATCVA